MQQDAMSLLQALDLIGFSQFFHGNLRVTYNAPLRLRSHPLQEGLASLHKTDVQVSTNWYHCRDPTCAHPLGPLDICLDELPEFDLHEAEGETRVCPLCGTTRRAFEIMEILFTIRSLRE